jgi:hypothetical protein
MRRPDREAMLAEQSSPVSGIVFIVAVLATSIVLVAAVAWASRQLLGLPVGTLRTFIAGLLGFVAAYLLGRSLHAAQPGHAVAFFTVAATWDGQQRVVKGGVSVTLPAVHEQLCTERVLVIEWLDGVGLRAAGPLIDDRGLDRAALSRALLRSLVYQITEGGVFHADPHPGNVLLLARSPC